MLFPREITINYDSKISDVVFSLKGNKFISGIIKNFNIRTVGCYLLMRVEKNITGFLKYISILIYLLLTSQGHF